MAGLHAQPIASAGAPLREVTRLERVAEPPGGLIPYRAGKLWGYADTTGRVVIRPSFEWSDIASTLFFTEQVARFTESDLPAGFRQPDNGEDVQFLLNARGEVLRVRPFEAAVRQPDGSLVSVPRWLAHGQLELVVAETQFGVLGSLGFSASAWRRVDPAQDVQAHLPEPGYVRWWSVVGAGRATQDNQPTDPHLLSRSDRPNDKDAILALTDLAGHHLTGHVFWDVKPFSEGLAVAVPALPAAPPGLEPAWRKHFYNMYTLNHHGYIDTTGRFVIPPIYWTASPFRGGVAVVGALDSLEHEQLGIVDRQGHFVLPMQPLPLTEPDAQGFVRRQVLTPTGRALEYLPPPGQPGFAGRLFEGAGPFRQGRAWARVGTRVGLLDAAGRWVTPRAYQQLQAPRRLLSYPGDALAEMEGEGGVDNAFYTSDFFFFDGKVLKSRHLETQLPPTVAESGSAWATFPLADPAYLVARRGGKYGVVARHSGREVVPARYDSVLFNPYRGVVCLQRAGRPYLVSTTTGRRLAAGRYAGVDFQTAHGRLHYLTRAAPAAWALVDTLGRRRTAWIPGMGYPTPQGWLLSHEPQGWTLRDSTGRLAYASANPIRQPEWSAFWEQLTAQSKLAVPGGQRNWTDDIAYWLLPLPASAHAGQGAYLVTDSLALHFLDARLHELGQVPRAGAEVFTGGWGRLPGSPVALFTDAGQVLPPPPGLAWWVDAGSRYNYDYARVWRQHGVLPTTQGYVTRGQRKLWE
jgi:hypothetical protein